MIIELGENLSGQDGPDKKIPSLRLARRFLSGRALGPVSIIVSMILAGCAPSASAVTQLKTVPTSTSTPTSNCDFGPDGEGWKFTDSLGKNHKYGLLIDRSNEGIPDGEKHERVSTSQCEDLEYFRTENK